MHILLIILYLLASISTSIIALALIKKKKITNIDKLISIILYCDEHKCESCIVKKECSKLTKIIQQNPYNSISTIPIEWSYLDIIELTKELDKKDIKLNEKNN